MPKQAVFAVVATVKDAVAKAIIATSIATNKSSLIGSVAE